MVCDPAKSIQEYSLKVAGPSKAPENPSTASWALMLEALRNRFYRSVKADLCKGAVMLIFVMQQEF